MARNWDELDRGQHRQEDNPEPETLSDGLYDQTPPESFGFPAFLERACDELKDRIKRRA